MINFLLGFVVAFVLSDAIAERFPQTKRFKVSLRELESMFPEIEQKKLSGINL